MNVTDDIFAPNAPSERSHQWATLVYAVVLVATVVLTCLTEWVPQ